MFEDLLPGDCFSIRSQDGEPVFMRMATGNDCLQLTGDDAGRVYEFPGYAVYPRQYVVIDNRDDTDLWSEDYGMFDGEDADEERARLLASLQG